MWSELFFKRFTAFLTTFDKSESGSVNFGVTSVKPVLSLEKSLA